MNEINSNTKLIKLIKKINCVFLEIDYTQNKIKKKIGCEISKFFFNFRHQKR